MSLGPTLLTAARTDVGPLKWADLPPAWLLTVLVVAGFLWIRTLYRRERGPSGPLQRTLLTILRAAVLILVLLVLSGPFREETRTVTERSHLVLLVDSSHSMAVKDRYPRDEEERLLAAAFPAGDRPGSIEDVSRGELVKRILAPNGESMLRDWDERFVLHAFAFDDDWRSLATTPSDDARRAKPEGEDDFVRRLGDAIRGLPMDGGRTRIGAVLRNVANEFARRQDRHLAGVILISDGRETGEGESPQQVLASLDTLKEELRVTAVGLGNPASGSNLWVERIRAKDFVLLGDEVGFETSLRHTKFTGVSGVRVEMTAEKIADEKGVPLPTPLPYAFSDRDARTRTEETGIELGPEDQSTEVRLRAPFREPGTFRVTIRAELPPRLRDEDAVPEDDARTHDVRVVDQRIRVLYVDEKPRHDWRFLSNYLTREPPPDAADSRSRFAVNVLLQLADREFQQPTSTDSAILPIKEFPRTRRELFEYDVIILGDVNWRLFNRHSPQESRRLLELLVEFVEEGGGIAFQAGDDYRNPLDFLAQPLAQLLPISAQQMDKQESEQGSPFTVPFRIELTEEGARHPIFSIVPGISGPIATPQEVASTWRGEQALSRDWAWYWMYRAKGGLRPGARALARVRAGGDPRMRDDRNQALVVFATMDFGKGRVFWSSLDTISRIRREHRDEFYGAFWEQVIRYLATYRLLGGNKRYKIFTDKDEYFVGETATVRITALDPYFEPLREPQLDGVFIESPGGEAVELTGDRRPRSQEDQGGIGTYVHYLPLRKQGQYRVWIEEAAAGPTTRTSRERAEKRVQVNFRAKEDILKVPDHETLRDIVRETNPRAHKGEVLPLYALSEAIERMQMMPRERILDRRERTQWDKAWVLLLITALLAAEWLLRKRWQMI